MATSSEVKAGLDDISELIAAAQAARERAKTRLLRARNQLSDIPGQFSDVIATIDGYAPNGAFETLAKDEKAKLQTEFAALKSSLESELDALGVEYQ